MDKKLSTSRRNQIAEVMPQWSLCRDCLKTSCGMGLGHICVLQFEYADQIIKLDNKWIRSHELITDAENEKMKYYLIPESEVKE